MTRLVQDQKVPNICILAVLGIGETWMREAEEGSRLARMFGVGGPHSAHVVIKEIETVQEKPVGRTCLLRFLRDWKKAHPLPEEANRSYTAVFA